MSLLKEEISAFVFAFDGTPRGTLPMYISIMLYPFRK